jgi:hypothetical protein
LQDLQDCGITAKPLTLALSCNPANPDRLFLCVFWLPR